MEWLVEMALKHTWRFAVAVVLVFAATGSLIWYQVVWLSPGKIYEDMLANNLAATSVTKRFALATGDQSIDQTMRLQTTASNASDWLIVARRGNSSITTENIATPSASYVRYVSIINNGKAVTGNGLLNQWAKSDGKTDSDLDQLFAEGLFDIERAPVPPIANLPPDERENLLAFNRDNKVFTPDYGKVKQEVVDGQNVDTFSVSVQLAAYVGLMQQFAHDLGMSGLDQLDANQYVGAPPVVLAMSVNRTSHQLVRVAYAANNFTQDYSDWGLEANVSVPNTNITTSELQRRLTAATKAV